MCDALVHVIGLLQHLRELEVATPVTETNEKDIQHSVIFTMTECCLPYTPYGAFPNWVYLTYQSGKEVIESILKGKPIQKYTVCI